MAWAYVYVGTPPPRGPCAAGRHGRAGGQAAMAGRTRCPRPGRSHGAPRGRRRRSALGARRSGARRSALGARRSAPRRSALALGARRSRARRSALGARRSALALGARRSALGARRSALGARRSALLIKVKVEQTASHHFAQIKSIAEPPLEPARSDDALPPARLRAGARVARARWPVKKSLHCGRIGGIRQDTRAHVNTVFH